MIRKFNKYYKTILFMKTLLIKTSIDIHVNINSSL